MIWRPSGNQNRPKIRFGGHLGSQDRPKIRFRSHLGGQNQPKMAQESAQQKPKTEPRGTKTQSSNAKTTRDPPGQNFPGYGAPPGAGFGARNRSKTDQKWIPKLILFLISFLINFGSQNRPKNGPKMDQKSTPKISSRRVISRSILNASLDG